MKYKMHNRSNRDVSDLQQMMKSFMPFAQKRIGFNKPPVINFESDDLNAKNALGKTGFYDPANMEVTVFVDGRHPKDVMRSLSHELVHHGQNCRGDFERSSGLGEQGYAQKDPHLREMEREAYEVGNLCFRDWEDNYKQQTNYVQVNVSLNENKQPRSKNMGIYDKKFNNLNKRLMEQWGYNTAETTTEDKESIEEFAVRDPYRAGEPRKPRRMRRSGEEEEEMEVGEPPMEMPPEGEMDPELAAAAAEMLPPTDPADDPEVPLKRLRKVTRQPVGVGMRRESMGDETDVFAPSHYCVHHGGVRHNGAMQMAEAVQHVEPDANGHITHYDMRLADGTILEDVAVEDIQVTDASLAEMHAKRDHDKMKKKKKKDGNDPELEERRGRGRNREGMPPDNRRRGPALEELRNMIRTTIRQKLMEKRNG